MPLLNGHCLLSLRDFFTFTMFFFLSVSLFHFRCTFTLWFGRRKEFICLEITKVGTLKYYVIWFVHSQASFRRLDKTKSRCIFVSFFIYSISLFIFFLVSGSFIDRLLISISTGWYWLDWIYLYIENNFGKRCN